ncbi:MAG: type IV pilus modification PilV family protein [Acidobacteriota bacterium]
MLASRRRRRDQAGFTLVELLVALSLLTIVAAGIAQLFAVTVRDARAARDQTMTMMLAMQKMEQLRGLTWRVDSAGGAVSDLTTDLSRSPPDASGSGLGASPAGTLDTNTAGFVDFLDSNGRWVGTGTGPPPAATYLRRWSIEPLPSDPGNSLLLRVLVTTRIRDAGATAAGQARFRRADEALLVTIRTRKAE